MLSEPGVFLSLVPAHWSVSSCQQSPGQLVNSQQAHIAIYTACFPDQTVYSNFLDNSLNDELMIKTPLMCML